MYEKEIEKQIKDIKTMYLEFMLSVGEKVELTDEEVSMGNLILLDTEIDYIQFLSKNLQKKYVNIQIFFETINKRVSGILEEDEYRKDLKYDEVMVERCYNRLMRMSKD